MSKPALGRGLGALLGTPPARTPAAPVVSAPPPPVEGPPGEAVQRVALNRIRPCPFQPRKSFPEEALRELADSIREQGIVQPLIVRSADGFYELIAGERRWRAAQLLGLAEVPVIVRTADDRVVLELALIENLQRENLNPIEEAQGYSQLIGQFQLTQEQAAAKVGKSRVVVANSLRLLKLDPEVQAHVRDGRLSVGHAKVILALAEPARQRLATERILKKSLTVRQTEDLVAHLQSSGPARPAGSRIAGAAAADPHLVQLQGRLQERLGTKVDLRYREGRGALQIHFFNDDDLERVLEILGVKPD
jgi:ParB family transcriptional regulator, chromosome partitioning protein